MADHLIEAAYHFKFKGIHNLNNEQQRDLKKTAEYFGVPTERGNRKGVMKSRSNEKILRGIRRALAVSLALMLVVLLPCVAEAQQPTTVTLSGFTGEAASWNGTHNFPLVYTIKGENENGGESTWYKYEIDSGSHQVFPRRLAVWVERPTNGSPTWRASLSDCTCFPLDHGIPIAQPITIPNTVIGTPTFRH